MALESPAGTLDLADLGIAVRKALGRSDAEIIDWHAPSIHSAMNSVTGGVYRVYGTARDDDEVLPWSLVLKITRNASMIDGAANDDSSTAPDWRREACLYSSGFLEHLPPGIRAPRCYGVTEPTEGTAFLWLEDIIENVESPWSPERYCLAARHLGQFNGAYLGWPLPTEPCLSRGWLRRSVQALSPWFHDLPEVRQRTDLRRYGWTAALLDRVERLSADKELYFGLLEHLPRTLCHGDAFRGNLLARRLPDGREETVAVDWAFSGIGAVGEDLAVLAASSIGFYHAEPKHIAELDRQAFEGYVAGLRDAGWQGDARLARLGYLAAAAMRVAIWPFWETLVNSGLASALESSVGHPLEDVLSRWAIVTEFFCDRVDEARDLEYMLT